jgi:myo-inositol-1(or 4)-monophosphatase/histidinol-phosphatase
MDNYLEFAKDLAYKAGKITLEYFEAEKEVELKNDASNSPVTIADKKINTMVIQEIQKRFPRHSIYGEEESSIKEDAEFLWICDPIDGTRPFTLGLPLSMFSLALTKNGVPMLGVTYDPYLDRLYYAEKGAGAYLNNKQIHVNTTNKLKGSYMGCSVNRPYIDMNAIRTELANEGVRTFMLWTSINEGTQVATSTFAATICPLQTFHDMAAIKIIVEEAGGKVTDLLGNEQRYDQPIKGALITNGILHDKLLDLVKNKIKIELL